MEINETIMAALRLKSEIDAKKAELAKLNTQLAAMAQYKEGSQTGHIYTNAYHVKVSKRQNVRWDQKKLTTARAAIGDKGFFAVFGWKFEPKNKALLDNFFEQGQQAHADLIRAAMTVTEGAPGISYEPLGE